MKLAGGLLLAIGAIMAATSIMYQNDTGRSAGLELIGGIVIAVIGIILFNVKPKK